MSRREGPSVWLFPSAGAVVAVAPFVSRILHDPITAQMNGMMFIAGVALPLLSVLYLFGQPALHEKVAVGLCWCVAGAILWSVDWGRLDSRVFVVGILFIVPTIVRLLHPR